MSPERESRGHADYDDPDYGEEIPRSVFSTTWFRPSSVFWRFPISWTGSARRA
jgi:hypothetical protein